MPLKTTHEYPYATEKGMAAYPPHPNARKPVPFRNVKNEGSYFRVTYRFAVIVALDLKHLLSGRQED